jgi:hypothetical protein
MTKAYHLDMGNRMISLLIAATFVLFQVFALAVSGEEGRPSGHLEHVTMSGGDPAHCDQVVDCLATHAIACAVHCMPSDPADMGRLDLMVTTPTTVELPILTSVLPSGSSPSPGGHPPRRRLV